MILLIACDVSMGLQLGAIDSDVSGTLGAPGHPCSHTLCHSSQERRIQGSVSLSSIPHTGLPSPNTLQEVQVAIINNSMCNHMYKKPDFRTNIWGDMVCAGTPEGGKDACFVSVTSYHHALLGPVP